VLEQSSLQFHISAVIFLRQLWGQKNVVDSVFKRIFVHADSGKIS
jgi:hypothetical protein